MLIDVNEVECARCNSYCHGKVVKIGGKYYHEDCFRCKVFGCNNNLIENGCFNIEGEYYCAHDYHQLQGCRCVRCHTYIQGEAIAVLDSFYHPACFSCHYCENVFLPNIEICYDGEKMSCKNCPLIISNDVACTESIVLTSDGTTSSDVSPRNCTDESNEEEEEVTYPSASVSLDGRLDGSKCAKCDEEIGNSQSLMALEMSWHLSCFACQRCGKLLADEYIGKDGAPYCEYDYQSLFGVSCAGCDGYITGKVLQAGGKHYHPSCARCGKCGDLFGEGEEMYVREDEIWHPRCSDEEELQVMNVTKADDSNSCRNNAFPSPPKPTEQNITIDDVETNNDKREDNEKDNDEEEDIPPVPPPPRRSSSNSWRLKYSTGVYAPTPFQKTTTVKKLSRVEPFIPNTPNSMAKDVSIPLSVITDNNDTLHLNDQLNGVSPQASPSLKGIGINRLQYRRSLRESQRKIGDK